MKLGEKFKVAPGDKKKLTYLFICSGIAVILLLFSQVWGGNSNYSVTTETNSGEENGEVENDKAVVLEEILGAMAGVGRVSVALEYDGIGVKEYAYNEEVSQRSGGSQGDVTQETTTRKEMVLLRGDEEPVVLSGEAPKVLGVVVVAEGAGNGQVREKILAAVTTYLDIGANRVEITAMEE